MVEANKNAEGPPDRTGRHESIISPLRGFGFVLFGYAIIMTTRWVYKIQL
jgi:hypothetical protein